MRCLMPGARPSIKPLSAGESSGSSTSDEVSQLELQSQRQLEEDIARIFDESIYSDLEVVCGKLKILTNSCILKARTHKFYHKLETILHVNIGRNIFDEIYSFISDAYTECDIKQQEKEIIDYLNENLSLGNNVIPNNKNKPEEKDAPEVYSTPNCVSPEEKSYRNTLSLSPSTELTKEYYALVPIDSNVLDRELIEQDALSDAFQSINKFQFEDINAKRDTPCVKPTSLCLNSSQKPKKNKRSNSCDILKKSHPSSGFTKKANEFDEKTINNGTSQTQKSIQQPGADKSPTLYNNSLAETFIEKVKDSTYTPDSLITDEPSSSSDYLSATYALSPGTAIFSDFSQLNVGESATKMENIVTISDSGLETAGMLESLNSHKDVTLTDVSLTESTLHDMINDDANCQDSMSNALDKSHVQIIKRSLSLNSHCGTSTGNDFNERKSNKSSFVEMNSTSTKEEKQRQNEEIVILESSSLSSETGSWESVFPPKLSEKDLCEKIIASERKSALDREITILSKTHEIHDDLCPSLVQKSPYKSTSCFIDAASLADECDDTITVQAETKVTTITSSAPVPSALKQDLSPNDWSGSNDNDDSLEQEENRHPDSSKKDISSTTFEVRPSTENPSSWNTCEADKQKPVTATHDPIIPGNMCADTHEINVIFNQEDFTSRHDPILAGNGFMQTININNSSLQLCANTQKLNNVGIQNKDFEEACSTRLDMNISGLSSTLRDTSNNSVTSLKDLNTKIYESESENDTLVMKYDSNSSNRHSDNDGGIPSSTYAIDRTPGLICKIAIENHDITLSGAQSNDQISSSFWVVDMSKNPKSDIDQSSIILNSKPVDKSSIILNSKPVDKSSIILNSKPVDKSVEELRSISKATTSGETYRSRSSVDSDCSEKSTHKFYIDLSTLPDASTSEHKDEGNEKKNIFSMFIDLGDNSTAAKDKPARFSSAKKVTKIESKSSSKGSKTPMGSVPKITSTTTQAPDENVLFEKLESLCADTSISISEIINCPPDIEVPVDVSEVSSDITLKDNDLTKNVIIEEPSTGEPLDLFVKLSDLDKPAPKVGPVTITVKRDNHERMSRSIPDNNWRDSNQTINVRSSEIISSFHSENALSLNRLFPHLKNDFSRSMPGSLSSRTRSPLRLGGVSSSPGDIDERLVSEISQVSSVQSSYCRSIVENSTTEEIDQTSSLISNCQSRLGQDLLRMFLEEIAPDVIVEVSGRRIKAHKCILSSRCQYFAGILSGGWVESAGNVISLPPFAFSVVHFALCHIYSGVTVIPDSINIVELATLTDMLGLEGLKEGIVFMLKAKYCHNFHEPCPLCIAGILECFPLAAVYGLDDLYRNCLRWITKNFYIVWPTKAYATLPYELIEKCCQELIINLSADNFIESVYGCAITVVRLATSRWAGTVVQMCRRAMSAAAQFAASRLCDVLRMMGAVANEAPKAAAHALEDCLAAAIEYAQPDQTCLAYYLLCVFLKEPPAQYVRPELVADGILLTACPNSLLSVRAAAWCVLCEGALVRNAPRVLASAAFGSLPVELRNRLRELGCIPYDTQKASWSNTTRRSSSARSSRAASTTCTTRSLDIDQVRECFVPYTPKPQPHLGSSDSLAVQDNRTHRLEQGSSSTARSSKPREERPALSKTSQLTVRTTKAQEERAKYNSTKKRQSVERVTTRPIRAAYGNAKPRYMEPRRPAMVATAAARKPLPKMSSSDSSRNSSPVLRGARARQPPPPASQSRTTDVSTDSISETQTADKYATYTKAKHNTEGSVEAVQKPVRSNAATLENTKNQPITKTKAKPTKIPIYRKKYAKTANTCSGTSKETQPRVQGEKSISNSSSPVQARSKNTERKPSGSLMNATKSSQAKMVSKTTCGVIKNAKPDQSKSKNLSRSPAGGIPVMERSGTFLKDEPMFGDKSTDIDDEKDIN